MQKLKQYSILLISAALLSFTGCTSSTNALTPSTHYEQPTPQKMALYQQTMRSVASGIQSDSKYQRITLNTPEKKAWFKILTYRLWDRQITRQQFMAEGLAKYPTHQHEFQFVINGFTNVCG